MDGNAVKEIARLTELASASVNRLEEDGVTYAPVKMYRVDAPLPEPATLTFRRLNGLIEWLNTVPSGPTPYAVHVVSDQRVEVITGIYGPHRQRTVLAAAVAPERMSATPFAFGKWLDVESMNIALLALFDETEGRKAVMKLLGTVKTEAVGTQTDDGVTQEVTVRGGITLVQRETVPNPVLLAPRRTFDEVEQPASPFVLRLKMVKSEEGSVTSAALFEADGGEWRSLAMLRIANHLVQADINLPILV